MDKLISINQIIEKLKDGMSFMVGGFLTNGGPNLVMDAICESNIKDLTLICNDAAFIDKGLGKLIANGQVKKLITSFIGSNSAAVDSMNNSTLEVEFSPQGTLAERIRAAGAGLGGVLTPTGLGTVVQEYILEKPLKAAVAFIGASIADRSGNLYFKGTTRNFNPIMAMAADLVIAEAEELVERGSIKPEDVHTPAILIDYIYTK